MQDHTEQVEAKRSLHDEVQRRVGRNLLLFQKIEGMLKLLVRVGDLKITLNKVEAIPAVAATDSSKMSLGRLVNDYCAISLANGEAEKDGLSPPRLGRPPSPIPNAR
jgi:hypothetical protein